MSNAKVFKHGGAVVEISENGSVTVTSPGDFTLGGYSEAKQVFAFHPPGQFATYFGIDSENDKKNVTEPVAYKGSTPVDTIYDPSNITVSGDNVWHAGTVNFGVHAPLTFDEYQQRAAKTAIYPDSAKITYPALGLASEAGEVAGKIKKVIRDSNGVYTPEIKKAISDELGGVLWYIAAVCRDLDIKMSDCGHDNLEILASRQKRNVLGGSGDNR